MELLVFQAVYFQFQPFDHVWILARSDSLLAMHVVAIAVVKAHDVPFDALMASDYVGTKGNHLLLLKNLFGRLTFREGASPAPYSYVD
jgi:hypothetical protein